MAGACWALPMPLVTSQTYVPKDNLITWSNNYHHEYVLKNNHIIYELIIIIINTCLRPRTWWGRWWGLPLVGWSPGPEKENENQNDQIVSTNYQLSELQILWWWSWSWLSSLAASGALLSLCMTSIWKQNTAWKWKQTEDQDQNIVTAI